MGRGKAWWESECIALCQAWVSVAREDTSAAAAQKPAFFDRLHAVYTECAQSIRRPGHANEPRSNIATRAKWREISRAVVDFDRHLRDVRAEAAADPTATDDEYGLLMKAIARQNGASGQLSPDSSHAPRSASGPGAFEFMSCWQFLRSVPEFWEAYASPEARQKYDTLGAHRDRSPMEPVRRPSSSSSSAVPAPMQHSIHGGASSANPATAPKSTSGLGLPAHGHGPLPSVSSGIVPHPVRTPTSFLHAAGLSLSRQAHARIPHVGPDRVTQQLKSMASERETSRGDSASVRGQRESIRTRSSPAYASAAQHAPRLYSSSIEGGRGDGRGLLNPISEPEPPRELRQPPEPPLRSSTLGDRMDIEPLSRAAKRSRTIRDGDENTFSIQGELLGEVSEHLRGIREEMKKRNQIISESNALTLFAMDAMRGSAAANEYLSLVAERHLNEMKLLSQLDSESTRTARGDPVVPGHRMGQSPGVRGTTEMFSPFSNVPGTMPAPGSGGRTAGPRGRVPRGGGVIGSPGQGSGRAGSLVGNTRDDTEFGK